MPYSIAFRSARFLAGPADTLKTRYGLVMWPPKMPKFGSWVDCMLGMSSGGNALSHDRSAEPPCNSCCVAVPEAWPSLISILFTYWWRTGSEACVHAGFLVKTTCLVGV